MDAAAFLALHDSNVITVSGIDYMGYQAVVAPLSLTGAGDVLGKGKGEKSEGFNAVTVSEELDRFFQNEGRFTVLSAKARELTEGGLG